MGGGRQRRSARIAATVEPYGTVTPFQLGGPIDNGGAVHPVDAGKLLQFPRRAATTPGSYYGVDIAMANQVVDGTDGRAEPGIGRHFNDYGERTVGAALIVQPGRCVYLGAEFYSISQGNRQTVRSTYSVARRTGFPATTRIGGLCVEGVDGPTEQEA